MPFYRQLILFLFLFLVFVPQSSSSDQKDSLAMPDESAWHEGVVDYRQPPFEQIEEWKLDPQYRYDRDAGPGIWDFLVTRVLYWLFSATEGRPWLFYVVVTLGGILVLFLLLRLLDVPVTGLFVFSRNPGNATLLFSDDNSEVSSEKLYQMFTMFRNNGAYREALRALFLLYLRELHDDGAISIRRFKTNYDYYREIPSGREKEIFRKRMHLFDVVWYGHVNLSSVQFNQLEKTFESVLERRQSS